MSWKQIALGALGIGAIVAGSLIPGAQAILVPVGAGLVGWALPAPKSPPKE